MSECHQTCRHRHTKYELRSSPPPRTIMQKCLLRVLCPVRRPVTTLDCVLLKDNSLDLAAELGTEINSRACFWVLLLLCIQPQDRLRSSKLVNRTLPCDLIGNSISTYSRMSRDPKSPTEWWVETSFNALWHFRTNKWNNENHNCSIKFIAELCPE
jgi:hypothetical protein